MEQTTCQNPNEKIPPEVWEDFLKDYVSRFIREELERFVLSNEQKAKELSLIERVIRVEEELKALREIESARFDAMEKRFEALQREMNARFEALQKEMNARFEALQKEMNARFESIDKRFEVTLKRFEAIDKRFEAIDIRFEAIEKRLTFLQWFLGIGFSAVLCLTSLMPLWFKLFQ